MKIYKSFLATIIVIVFTSKISWSQDLEKAFANADTTNFSVNQKQWRLLNSFVGATEQKDSVALELILMHIDSNQQWETDMFVGKIRTSSINPTKFYIFSFNILNAVYKFKIDPTGNCYLSLTEGNPPIDDMPIIFIKGTYPIN